MTLENCRRTHYREIISKLIKRGLLAVIQSNGNTSGKHLKFEMTNLDNILDMEKEPLKNFFSSLGIETPIMIDLLNKSPISKTFQDRVVKISKNHEIPSNFLSKVMRKKVETCQAIYEVFNKKKGVRTTKNIIQETRISKKSPCHIRRAIKSMVEKGILNRYRGLDDLKKGADNPELAKSLKVKTKKGAILRTNLYTLNNNENIIYNTIYNFVNEWNDFKKQYNSFKMKILKVF